MEFPFDVASILPGRITVIKCKDCNVSLRIYDLESENAQNQESEKTWTFSVAANAPWDLRIKRKREELETVIDKMGLASAQAQNLRSPITTLKKLVNSSQQKIYTIRDVDKPCSIIGMLKVGIKRLFVCDDIGAHHEVDPLCVLDFYVHESKQRCGLGHELFDAMLQAENILPEKLAIDRPSLKCLSFLQKHYNLKGHIQQTNNFVIYPGFFIDRTVTRPPIFLYDMKAVQSPQCSSSKQKPCRSDVIEALHPFQIPLSSKEIKKNKTFYSSSGNCLTWSDNATKSEPYQRKYGHQTESNKSKDSHIWGVEDAMHSYPATQLDGEGYNKGKTKVDQSWGANNAMHTNDEVSGWNKSKSFHCSLTPVETSSKYSQRKWNQLESSWNVLGVKPMDYSLYQAQF